jgi:hypothetical protein
MSVTKEISVGKRLYVRTMTPGKTMALDDVEGYTCRFVTVIDEDLVTTKAPPISSPNYPLKKLYRAGEINNPNNGLTRTFLRGFVRISCKWEDNKPL